jgi:hypothetical protein
MTAPDPVQLLREAGVEVPEIGAYQETMVSELDVFVDRADAAILALAKMVKEMCVCGNCARSCPDEPWMRTEQEWPVECRRSSLRDHCHFTPSRWEQHRGK